MAIDRPNQVWAADVTYIPLGRGFLYLVAIMDWASRAVLNWRLSNTMDVSFCVSALEEALTRIDNVFIERLWRSLKHEDIYLKAYADGREARAGIASWMAFYNGRRPDQALGHRTPMAVCRAGVSGAKAVDMMDNARALPTCPQPQQLQQTASLAA